MTIKLPFFFNAISPRRPQQQNKTNTPIPLLLFFFYFLFLFFVVVVVVVFCFLLLLLDSFGCLGVDILCWWWRDGLGDSFALSSPPLLLPSRQVQLHRLARQRIGLDPYTVKIQVRAQRLGPSQPLLPRRAWARTVPKGSERNFFSTGSAWWK